LPAEERFEKVELLAKSIMNNITQVVPVLPVALMCEVLLDNRSEWKSELELKTQCAQRIKELETIGAPIDISSNAIESVLGSALEALEGRGLVEEQDKLYLAEDSELDILNYYANSIVQWRTSVPSLLED
ncbi:MAG: hypothetical protein IMF14_03490, partial [Proteobacteria bacterium]|nr:hypothetical protein [Pseudomonadota bacterium]